MPISTKVVSANSARTRCAWYSFMGHFVSDVWRVGVFLRVLWFHRPWKLTPQDETLLKVALNTITITLKFFSETAWSNEVKLGSKHPWKVFSSFRSINKHGRHRQFLFLLGQFLLIWNWFAKTFYHHLAFVVF